MKDLSFCPKRTKSARESMTWKWDGSLGRMFVGTDVLWRMKSAHGDGCWITPILAMSRYLCRQSRDDFCRVSIHSHGLQLPRALAPRPRPVDVVREAILTVDARKSENDVLIAFDKGPATASEIARRPTNKFPIYQLFLSTLLVFPIKSAPIASRTADCISVVVAQVVDCKLENEPCCIVVAWPESGTY
jgi:hypothetical protein